MIFPFLDPNNAWGSPAQQIKSHNFISSCLAEGIASFWFLFFTISCVLYTGEVTGGPLDSGRMLMISSCFGIMISILVFIFAAISGGNINPAVSFGLFLTGKISGTYAVGYMLSQCIGASFGVLVVQIINRTAFDSNNGASNAISSNHSTSDGLTVEIICTALLMFTVMAATDSYRSDAHKHLPTIAPIIVGAAVAAAHFVAIPVTNCSINPARSFSTSLISGHWDDHWVFWFGPMLGSAIAALGYNFIFSHTHPDFDTIGKDKIQTTASKKIIPYLVAADDKKGDEV